MKISVIGTGYVGLVSGACLAERGHQVTCVDIRPEVVSEINAGRPPIHEVGLEDLLRAARDKDCYPPPRMQSQPFSIPT